jgi:hypothetical protein
MEEKMPIPIFAKNPTRLVQQVRRNSGVKKHLLLPSLCLLFLSACTQESQNQWGRSIQNWTGVNGILEIYAGEKLVKKFIQVDKLTTATATDGGPARPYRFGYGVLDENFDGLKSADEKRVYFEFSDYSTSYVFYESPR